MYRSFITLLIFSINVAAFGEEQPDLSPAARAALVEQRQAREAERERGRSIARQATEDWQRKEDAARLLPDGDYDLVVVEQGQNRIYLQEAVVTTVDGQKFVHLTGRADKLLVRVREGLVLILDPIQEPSIGVSVYWGWVVPHYNPNDPIRCDGEYQRFGEAQAKGTFALIKRI